jgi:plastocyanin
MTPRICVLGLLGAAAFVAPGLASDTIRITIDKLTFSPAQVSAHVGDTVEWVSADFIAHTATSRGKDWDVAIPANGRGKIVLTHAGDVEYFCRYHPNMTGKISVAGRN